LRQELCADQEINRNQHVIKVIDDIFELVTIEPQNELFDSGLPGQRAVRGVDHHCRQHHPECGLEVCLLDKQQS
jgi:hypothetical protein